MQILLQCGLEQKPAKIPQHQTMANEYIYAKDMGRAVDLAATVPLPEATTFNIGNGWLTPFEEIADIARELLPGLKIEIEPGTPPKSKSQPLDISLAGKYLGWEPQYSMKTAFEDYLQELKSVGPDFIYAA